MADCNDPAVIQPLIICCYKHPRLRRLIFDLKSGLVNNAITKNKLSFDLLTKEYFKIFVGLGIAGTEEQLIKALNKYGQGGFAHMNMSLLDRKWMDQIINMALIFMNSGNSRLKEGAKNWASEHGYLVRKGRSAGTLILKVKSTPSVKYFSLQDRMNISWGSKRW